MECNENGGDNDMGGQVDGNFSDEDNNKTPQRQLQ